MSVTYEVHEQENGSADIERVKRSPVSDWAQAQSLNVLAEHRAAVALALLGDRDALVEQIAEGIWRGKGFGRTYPTFAGRPEVIKDLYRRDARAVLAAIGGGGEGEQ